MPTYVYKFVETGETIEVQQAFTDDALTEATHPGTGKVMQVKKVFTPVGVTFKGGGFYKTDSRGSSSSTSAGSSSSSSASSSGDSSSSTSSSSSDSSSMTSHEKPNSSSTRRVAAPVSRSRSTSCSMSSSTAAKLAISTGLKHTPPRPVASSPRLISNVDSAVETPNNASRSARGMRRSPRRMSF